MKIENLMVRWREILLVLLVICSICWIHPNTQSGVVTIAANPPASLSIKRGDIIYEVNGIRIEKMEDFQRAIAAIKPNDTVRITVLREAFPFLYFKEETYPFLAEIKDNNTYLGLSVSSIQKMNALFENIVVFKEVILGSNNTVNMNEIKDIIEKRLSIFGLRNFWLNVDDQKISLRFIKGNIDAIKDLLTKKGRFEAKINETLIFSTNDVLKVCLNPQACTFQMFREYEAENETYGKVIWRYYIQVITNKESYQRFKAAIANLSIKECLLEICYLNETLDYYLDNEKIEGGSTRISNTSKTREIDSFLITGKGMSFEEIFTKAREIQAFLSSKELPTELQILEEKEIKSEKNLLLGLTILFLSTIAYPVYGIIKNKDTKKEIKRIFILLILIFITIGFLSLSEVLINEFTFYGISLALLTQFLKGNKFRKWILIAASIVFIILMISFSIFSFPFLIMLVLIELFLK
ncbi:MAG: PDZ domain-containing protein [Candidatus Parvarchaeota archaeon]|nr:PDZ domain-containing protein [Candidatus Jingweiarchaeum tengchongense]MCW1300454.1 PDZ domain-containing protein [Candidatus Jingweiarchaeum tengchongense]MCW1304956.1 PDZ domain-containing protein [Candidatus Jingweiarchaeum tengchongense]MCW1305484.1 PDZ domain-containing protein [Candidatus Jingweiarchaeum tengchongense]